MQIQLKDLDVFVKVAENRSFTKASEILFVAQPSLSKTVMKLEKELQVLLFDRSNRKLNLTEEGKVVYEKSKEILSTLESIPISLSELSQLVTGNLKIGLSHIVSTLFYPKIAQTYYRKFPGVTIEAIEEGGLAIEKKVEKGLLDIGFVVFPTNSKNLTCIPIHKEEFVLCASSNHPLAKLQEVSLIDLKDEHFIFFSKTWRLRELIGNACQEVGYNPKTLFESVQWDLILELVSAQLGITLMPKSLANKLNGIDIVSIPVIEPTIVWNVGVVTNSNSYQSPALKEFLSVIHQIYH